MLIYSGRLLPRARPPALKSELKQDRSRLVYNNICIILFLPLAQFIPSYSRRMKLALRPPLAVRSLISGQEWSETKLLSKFYF